MGSAKQLMKPSKSKFGHVRYSSSQKICISDSVYYINLLCDIEYRSINISLE